MAQKESIHLGILDQVQTDIRALITATKIVGIASASVLVRKVPVGLGVKSSPAAGEIQAPAIIISPFGRTYEPYDNAFSLIGYRVGIAVLDVDNQDLAVDEAFMGWLETIEDQFVSDVLDVSTVSPAVQMHDCMIDAALSVSFQQWLGNWAVGATVLTFRHKKIRGNP